MMVPNLDSSGDSLEGSVCKLDVIRKDGIGRHSRQTRYWGRGGNVEGGVFDLLKDITRENNSLKGGKTYGWNGRGSGKTPPNSHK